MSRRRAENACWKRRLSLADEVVQRTLRRLPEEVGQRAVEVLIRYEPAVGPELIAEGIEPDTLGLFEGCSFADQLASSDALPPRILLFLDSLWEEAGEDEEIFREEVRRTYLHELGHFLGLDEDGLYDRDLD